MEAEVEATQPKQPSQQKLALVVEDNGVPKLINRRWLEQAGYSVEFADDGEMALTKIRSRIEANLPSYDVISLDFTMPNLNGVETLVEIRKLNLHYARVGVVFVSTELETVYREIRKAFGVTSGLAFKACTKVGPIQYLEKEAAKQLKHVDEPGFFRVGYARIMHDRASSSPSALFQPERALVQKSACTSGQADQQQREDVRKRVERERNVTAPAILFLGAGKQVVREQREVHRSESASLLQKKTV